MLIRRSIVEPVMPAVSCWTGTIWQRQLHLYCFLSMGKVARHGKRSSPQDDAHNASRYAQVSVRSGVVSEQSRRRWVAKGERCKFACLLLRDVSGEVRIWCGRNGADSQMVRARLGANCVNRGIVGRTSLHPSSLLGPETSSSLENSCILSPVAVERSEDDCTSALLTSLIPFSSGRKCTRLDPGRFCFDSPTTNNLPSYR
jgi:hypothetical protein